MLNGPPNAQIAVEPLAAPSGQIRARWLSGELGAEQASKLQPDGKYCPGTHLGEIMLQTFSGSGH